MLRVCRLRSERLGGHWNYGISLTGGNTHTLRGERPLKLYLLALSNERGTEARKELDLSALLVTTSRRLQRAFPWLPHVEVSSHLFCEVTLQCGLVLAR